MELILTGLPVTATEMEQRGVVNRVVSSDGDVLEEALLVAKIITARSAPALRLAKHVVKTGKSALSTCSGDLQADGTSRDHNVERGVRDRAGLVLR